MRKPARPARECRRGESERGDRDGLRADPSGPRERTFRTGCPGAFQGPPALDRLPTLTPGCARGDGMGVPAAPSAVRPTRPRRRRPRQPAGVSRRPAARQAPRPRRAASRLRSRRRPRAGRPGALADAERAWDGLDPYLQEGLQLTGGLEEVGWAKAVRRKAGEHGTGAAEEARRGYISAVPLPIWAGRSPSMTAGIAYRVPHPREAAAVRRK
jgi:hypothetical protein